MKDDKLGAFKKAKFGDDFAREEAKAHYEDYCARKAEAHIQPSDTWVEAKIKKALAEGAFDNLEGQGKPLELDTYFDPPEHLRIAYHMLKNAGFVPEEVRLSKEIESLQKALAAATTDEQREAIQKKINRATTDYGFYMDYNRKYAKKLF